jgi:hypothetical protein
LLSTIAISISTSYNALAYKKNQATSQANACGNDFLPTNIGCQNTDSQIQGDENTIALASQQTYPEVEREKPPKNICPIVAPNYVWDLTLNQPLPPLPEVLPAGTVLCSDDGLGIQFVDTLGGGGAIIVVLVDILLSVNSECPEFYVKATVSSGTPPTPLVIGDTVCVTSVL